MGSKATLNSTFGVLSGPSLGLGDLLNAFEAAINALSVAAAAHSTVTIAGTPHAGDLVTITVGGNPVNYTSLANGALAGGTVTVAGTVETGDVLEVTVAGNLVLYQLGGGDTTATLAAASLRDALNANSTFSALFVATSALGVVTITAKLPGTAGNVTLVASVGGHTPTTTLTASGANLTGGVNGDTVTTIAVALKNAINADPLAGLLVVATNAAGVITLTAIRKGTSANAITLTAAVTGAGATVTATAASATLGGAGGVAGSGTDDLQTIT